MSDLFSGLTKLAPHLDRLTADPNARVGYELMSGGLTWSDESPPMNSVEFDVFCSLRTLWRFRSSLIVSEPDERFREHWDFAKQASPNWPGFLPERCDVKWRDFFRKEEKRLANVFEDLDSRWRAQQPSGASPSRAENVAPQDEIRI